MSGIDYLESAKQNIMKTNGDHPADYVSALSLAAIAYALIAIAERMTK